MIGFQVWTFDSGDICRWWVFETPQIYYLFIILYLFYNYYYFRGASFCFPQPQNLENKTHNHITTEKTKFYVSTVVFWKMWKFWLLWLWKYCYTMLFNSLSLYPFILVFKVQKILQHFLLKALFEANFIKTSSIIDQKTINFWSFFSTYNIGQIQVPRVTCKLYCINI